MGHPVCAAARHLARQVLIRRRSRGLSEGLGLAFDVAEIVFDDAHN